MTVSTSKVVPSCLIHKLDLLLISTTLSSDISASFEQPAQYYRNHNHNYGLNEWLIFLNLKVVLLEVQEQRRSLLLLSYGIQLNQYWAWVTVPAVNSVTWVLVQIKLVKHPD